MNTLVCSYDVRGLGIKEKRILTIYPKKKKIFSWLKEKKYSLVLLQEIYSSSVLHNLWQEEGGGWAF